MDAVEMETDLTTTSPVEPTAIDEALADAESHPQGTCQFVTFAIGTEEYAVDIMQVREIQAWSEVTILPNQQIHARSFKSKGCNCPHF